MSYYDFFSRFYDSSVEKLYLEHRKLAREALDLSPGVSVLDAGCGTGQSFDQLVDAVGSDGRVVGVDASRGMLKQAAARVTRNEWRNVDLAELSLHELDAAALAGALHGEAAEVAARGFDRVLCFLVLSTLPDYDEAFDRVFSLLRAGGRAVIVDTHRLGKLGFYGRMVNLTARADIRREVWTVLERRGEGFALERHQCDKRIGGDIIVASATRAG